MADQSGAPNDGYPTAGELLQQVVDTLNTNLAALRPNDTAEKAPEQPA